MSSRLDLYPIAIIEDRYTGVYSGGTWLAIAVSDNIEATGESRVQWCLGEGPYGDDSEAADFGRRIPNINWIGVGNTPQEALDNLYAKNTAYNSAAHFNDDDF